MKTFSKSSEGFDGDDFILPPIGCPIFVALHNSIATALDPTLDIAEGTFPVASAIDVWVRDPPAVSSLPARGA